MCGMVSLFPLNPVYGARVAPQCCLILSYKSIFSIPPNKPVVNVQLCLRGCSVCANGTVQPIATKVFNWGAALLEYFVHFILLHEHCFKKTVNYFGLTFNLLQWSVLFTKFFKQKTRKTDLSYRTRTDNRVFRYSLFVSKPIL